MAAYAYSEDTLVQQTTADYLRDELGWETVFAYNQETFGPEGMLGRDSDREVVLTRYLQLKLMEFNPGLPADVYREAVRQIVESSAAQSLVATNRDKYGLLKDGVQVGFRNEKGERVKRRLRVFDFNEPANNHFLAVRELWVKGDLYRRRADVVGFVNGIPLLFVELKNIHKDIRAAYEKNLADYKDTVPHLFHHNALIVLANGIEAKIGSITSRFEHFHEWKRLAEEEPGPVGMQTLLKGVCDKLGVSIGDLNERIAAKLEEIDTGDINVRERLEKELKRDYHVITAAKRLDQIALDFVEHYSTAWESGKAMFVCIDKVTCVRMCCLPD